MSVLTIRRDDNTSAWIHWNYFSLCRNPEPEMTPEERDARTVFCMQRAARIRPRDLEEFFSSVGKVCDLSTRIYISFNNVLSN